MDESKASQSEDSPTRSRFGRTRKPKVTSDFCDIDEFLGIGKKTPKSPKSKARSPPKISVVGGTPKVRKHLVKTTVIRKDGATLQSPQITQMKNKLKFVNAKKEEIDFEESIDALKVVRAIPKQIQNKIPVGGMLKKPLINTYARRVEEYYDSSSDESDSDSPETELHAMWNRPKNVKQDRQRANVKVIQQPQLSRQPPTNVLKITKVKPKNEPKQTFQKITITPDGICHIPKMNLTAPGRLIQTTPTIRKSRPKQTSLLKPATITQPVKKTPPKINILEDIIFVKGKEAKQEVKVEVQPQLFNLENKIQIISEEGTLLQIIDESELANLQLTNCLVAQGDMGSQEEILYDNSMVLDEVIIEDGVVNTGEVYEEQVIEDYPLPEGTILNLNEVDSEAPLLLVPSNIEFLEDSIGAEISTETYEEGKEELDADAEYYIDEGEVATIEEVSGADGAVYYEGEVDDAIIYANEEGVVYYEGDLDNGEFETVVEENASITSTAEQDVNNADSTNAFDNKTYTTQDTAITENSETEIPQLFETTTAKNDKLRDKSPVKKKQEVTVVSTTDNSDFSRFVPVKPKSPRKEGKSKKKESDITTSSEARRRSPEKTKSKKQSVEKEIKLPVVVEKLQEENLVVSTSGEELITNIVPAEAVQTKLVESDDALQKVLNKQIKTPNVVEAVVVQKMEETPRIGSPTVDTSTKLAVQKSPSKKLKTPLNTSDVKHLETLLQLEEISDILSEDAIHTSNSAKISVATSPSKDYKNLQSTENFAPKIEESPVIKSSETIVKPAERSKSNADVDTPKICKDKKARDKSHNKSLVPSSSTKSEVKAPKIESNISVSSKSHVKVNVETPKKSSGESIQSCSSKKLPVEMDATPKKRDTKSPTPSKKIDSGKKEKLPIKTYEAKTKSAAKEIQSYPSKKPKLFEQSLKEIDAAILDKKPLADSSKKLEATPKEIGKKETAIKAQSEPKQATSKDSPDRKIKSHRKHETSRRSKSKEGDGEDSRRSKSKDGNREVLRRSKSKDGDREDLRRSKSKDGDREDLRRSKSKDGDREDLRRSKSKDSYREDSRRSKSKDAESVRSESSRRSKSRAVELAKKSEKHEAKKSEKADVRKSEDTVQKPEQVLTKSESIESLKKSDGEARRSKSSSKDSSKSKSESSSKSERKDKEVKSSKDKSQKIEATTKIEQSIEVKVVAEEKVPLNIEPVEQDMKPTSVTEVLDAKSFVEQKESPFGELKDTCLVESTTALIEQQKKTSLLEQMKECNTALILNTEIAPPNFSQPKEETLPKPKVKKVDLKSTIKDALLKTSRERPSRSPNKPARYLDSEINVTQYVDNKEKPKSQTYESRKKSGSRQKETKSRERSKDKHDKDKVSKSNDKLDTDQKSSTDKKKYKTKRERSQEKIKEEPQEKVKLESVEAELEKNISLSQEKIDAQPQENIKAETQEKINAGTQEEIQTESQEKIKVETQEKIKAESQEKIKGESQEKIKAESQEGVKAELQENVKAESQKKVKTESQEKVKAESPEKVKAESQEKVKAESQENLTERDKVKAEPEMKVKSRSLKKNEAESQEIIEAESQETIKAESQKTIKAESQETIKAESQETIKAESQETIKAESQETIKAESQTKVRSKSRVKTEVESQETLAESEMKAKSKVQMKIVAESRTIKADSQDPQTKRRGRSQQNVETEAQVEVKAVSQEEVKESQRKRRARSQEKVEAESPVEVKAESPAEVKAESPVEVKAESPVEVKADLQEKIKEAVTEPQRKRRARSQGKVEAETQLEAESQEKLNLEVQEKIKAEPQEKIPRRKIKAKTQEKTEEEPREIRVVPQEKLEVESLKAESQELQEKITEDSPEEVKGSQRKRRGRSREKVGTQVEIKGKSQEKIEVLKAEPQEKDKAESQLRVKAESQLKAESPSVKAESPQTRNTRSREKSEEANAKTVEIPAKRTRSQEKLVEQETVTEEPNRSKRTKLSNVRVEVSPSKRRSRRMSPDKLKLSLRVEVERMSAEDALKLEEALAKISGEIPEKGNITEEEARLSETEKLDEDVQIPLIKPAKVDKVLKHKEEELKSKDVEDINKRVTRRSVKPVVEDSLVAEAVEEEEITKRVTKKSLKAEEPQTPEENKRVTRSGKPEFEDETPVVEESNKRVTRSVKPEIEEEAIEAPEENEGIKKRVTRKGLKVEEAQTLEEIKRVTRSGKAEFEDKPEVQTPVEIKRVTRGGKAEFEDKPEARTPEEIKRVSRSGKAEFEDKPEVQTPVEIKRVTRGGKAEFEDKPETQTSVEIKRVTRGGKAEFEDKPEAQTPEEIKRVSRSGKPEFEDKPEVQTPAEIKRVSRRGKPEFEEKPEARTPEEIKRVSRSGKPEFDESLVVKESNKRVTRSVKPEIEEEVIEAPEENEGIKKRVTRKGLKVEESQTPKEIERVIKSGKPEFEEKLEAQTPVEIKRVSRSLKPEFEEKPEVQTPGEIKRVIRSGRPEFDESPVVEESNKRVTRGVKPEIEEEVVKRRGKPEFEDKSEAQTPGEIKRVIRSGRPEFDESPVVEESSKRVTRGVKPEIEEEVVKRRGKPEFEDKSEAQTPGEIKRVIRSGRPEFDESPVVEESNKRVTRGVKPEIEEEVVKRRSTRSAAKPEVVEETRSEEDKKRITRSNKSEVEEEAEQLEALLEEWDEEELYKRVTRRSLKPVENVEVPKQVEEEKRVTRGSLNPIEPEESDERISRRTQSDLEDVTKKRRKLPEITSPSQPEEKKETRMSLRGKKSDEAAPWVPLPIKVEPEDPQESPVKVRRASPRKSKVKRKPTAQLGDILDDVEIIKRAIIDTPEKVAEIEEEDPVVEEVVEKQPVVEVMEETRKEKSKKKKKEIVLPVDIMKIKQEVIEDDVEQYVSEVEDVNDAIDEVKQEPEDFAGFEASEYNEVSKFHHGDLVYSKLGHYPYWPCLITEDPFMRLFKKKLTASRRVPLWAYHVRFFGDRGRRAWVREANILPFTGKDDIPLLCKKLKEQGVPRSIILSSYKVPIRFQAMWNTGINEALSLQNKSIDQRYEFFFDMFASKMEKIAKLREIKQEPREEISIQIKQERLEEAEAETEVEEVPVKTRKRRSSPIKRIKAPVEIKQEFEEVTRPKSQLSLDLFSEASLSDTDSSSKWSVRTPIPVTQESQTALYKRNALFKGVLRDRVCQICLQPGDVLKCKGKCYGYYHKSCSGITEERPIVQEEIEVLSDDGNDSDCQIISIKDKYERQIQPLTLNTDAAFKKMTLAEQIDFKLMEVMKPIADKTYYADSSSDYTSSEESSTEAEVVEHVTADDVIFTSKPLKKHGKTFKNDNFKCAKCIANQDPECFVCGKEFGPGNSAFRQKCSLSMCGKFYHKKCLRLWPQAQFSLASTSKGKDTETSDTFTCPMHVCHICVSDNPKAAISRLSSDKVVRCLKCPATYHSNTFCIPAGTSILSSTQIICPRHVGYDQIKGRAPRRTINTTWCFICSQGGDLVCCETCPTSIHAECSRVNLLDDDTFMCEDCETGRLPLYDEIVWVKLGSYRWWPALILFPNDIPENIINVPHLKGEFVVKFFGTHDHYWVQRGRVFLFQEGDQGPGASTKKMVDRVFNQAVEEAASAHCFKTDFKKDKEDSIKMSEKPPPYIKIKINRPVGNVKMFDGNISNTTPCNCDPNGETPCSMDNYCLNRLLLTECDPEVCAARELCQNQSFEKREYPPLVPYRTKTRGWGLKTLAPVRKGQFVIEYVGELIDYQECQRRMTKMHEQKDDNYYFLTINKDRLIDAGPKGNLSRFMNHCCEPNCETQKWTVKGETRVGLFAKTDIPEDTEVTFNYNLECVGEDKKICKCGAPACSGFIGVKAKNPNDEKKPKKHVSKLKKKHSPAPVSPAINEPCFVCGTVGNTFPCSNKVCPKYYHLGCVKMETVPEGKWSCPWHYCNVCLKRTIRCCVKCTKSYCPGHSEGNVRYDNLLGFICTDHDPTKEPQEILSNVVKKSRKSPIPTEESDVTSTTFEEIDLESDRDTSQDDIEHAVGSKRKRGRPKRPHVSKRQKLDSGGVKSTDSSQSTHDSIYTTKVPERHLRVGRKASEDSESERLLKRQRDFEKDLPIRKRTTPRTESTMDK